MPRVIKPIASTCTVEAITQLDDLQAWLQERATMLHLPWLLAYTDSGVIWGELRADELALSSTAFPRTGLSLRHSTLHHARLFGEPGELHLWRGPNEQWQYTLRMDSEGATCECFDEAYMLWGNTVQATHNGFHELREGGHGIIHAPPLRHQPSDTKRARLTMRHYVQHDTSGLIRMTAQRLLNLKEAEV